MLIELSLFEEQLVLDWFYNQVSLREISKKLSIPRNRIEALYRKYNLTGKNKYDRGKVCLTCLLHKSISEFNRTDTRKCSLCEVIYHSIMNSSDRYKIKRVEYRENNREKLNEFDRNKIKKDVIYKLKRRVSGSIRSYLKENRGGRVMVDLPYSIEDLKNHIEGLFDASWMTWQNHGVYNKKTWKDDDPSTWTWQIDHIVAHSKFLYKTTKDDDFKKCWTLTNLRPYSSKQNCIDGVRA